MNTNNLPKVEVTNLDKLLHCIMTMGLSGVVFFNQTFYLKKRSALWQIWIATWLIPVVYTGGIEILQGVVSPYRSGDWADFWSNVAGATLGFVINCLINRGMRVKR